jgi:hypothetical protein
MHIRFSPSTFGVCDDYQSISGLIYSNNWGFYYETPV